MSVLSLDRSINKDSLQSIGFKPVSYVSISNLSVISGDHFCFEQIHDILVEGPFGKSNKHIEFIYYPKDYKGPVMIYAKHNNIKADNIVFVFYECSYNNVKTYNPKDIDDLGVWMQETLNEYTRFG